MQKPSLIFTAQFYFSPTSPMPLLFANNSGRKTEAQAKKAAKSTHQRQHLALAEVIGVYY